MIIKLEIEQMIKELSNHNSNKARDYINVLNRVILEMREQNKALKDSMMLTSNSELAYLEIRQVNRELITEVDKLNNLVNTLGDA